MNTALSYATATTTQLQHLVAQLGGSQKVLGPEVQRASSFKQQADQEAFLASRALLRLAVAFARHGSFSSAAAESISRYCPDCQSTDHGRPQTPGFSISMSRTRHRSAVLIGPENTALGIDIEQGTARRDPGIFHGFDQISLCDAERQLVARAAQPDTLRLAAWSGKEAVLKATGEGLRRDPATLHVLPSDSLRSLNSQSWHQLPGPSVPSLWLRWPELQDDHVVAVASSKALSLHDISQNFGA